MTDIPINPIEVTPQQKMHYETLFPTISALTEYMFPAMPVEEAVGEASRVLALIKEDRAKLERSGIELKYLDSFEARAGALTWSATQVVTYIEMGSSAKKEWGEMQPEADNLRRILLKTLTRAFRNDKELTDAVKRIREGQGSLDRVLDFLSMHKLAKENEEKLKAIFADPSLIEQASEFHTRLSETYSRMVINPEKLNEAKVIYYKAWTYLKEAINEVYEAGQYVFDEDDPKHVLYSSNYHMRLGQASVKAKKSMNETQQKSEMDKEMVDA